MMPNDIKGILTSKIGGVPVILIGVVGVGGLAWYLSHKSSGTDSTDNTDANGIASSGLDASTNPYPTISNTYINVPQPGGTATTPTSPSTGNTTPPSPIVNPLPYRPPGLRLPPVLRTLGGGSSSSPPKTGITPIKHVAAKQTSKTYVVQSGDNLTKIAKAEGISLSALEKANAGVIKSTAQKHGIRSEFNNFIYKGEKLVIPA